MPKDREELAALKAMVSRLQRENALLYSASSIILRWLPNGIISFVNEYGLNFFGYSESELIGKHVSTLVPAIESSGRDLTGLADDFLKHPENYKIFTNENVCKNGDRVWINWANKAVTDSNGNMLEILAIGNDVSAQKKTEDALRQSESRTRAVLDSLAEGIAFFDTGGSLIDTNVTLPRILGHTVEELVDPAADTSKHIIRNDDSPMPLEEQPVMVALNTGRGVYNVEMGVPRTDGSIVWTIVNAQPVHDNNQEVIGAVASFFDVTERKLAEKALRESENRFRQLADSMPQLVWTANPDGTVDYYNERHKHFGGISPGPDGIWHWGPAVYEEDAKRTIDAWSESVKTGNTYQIEHRIKHTDGSVHWYLSRGIPVRDDCGHIVKWYGTATNIDIGKQSELALEESERRLKALNENLETIITQRTKQVRELSRALTLAEQRERKRFSNILHENLQQMLFGAKMLLGQHVREHETSAQKEGYDDVTEGLAIINKALQMTRTLSIELNPPVLQKQGLDIALEWLTDHMQKNYDLSIELQMSRSLSRVRDENQLMLGQMVRELLNNVVQHSGVLAARLEATCEERWVKIVVSDEGRGFDPEKTLEDTEDKTRLGLFSIRERLRLFGGDLTIRSAEGEGTHCTILLPIG